MLWKQSLARIRLRLTVSAAFRRAAQKQQIRRRRSSILANLHSGARNVNFGASARESVVVFEAQSSQAVDHWHRAITQIVIECRVVRCFKEFESHKQARMLTFAVSDTRGMDTNTGENDKAPLLYAPHSHNSAFNTGAQRGDRRVDHLRGGPAHLLA